MRVMRWLRRGIEAADILTYYGADFRSRRRLLGAYAALAHRKWDAAPFDIRLRVGGRVAHLRMRQRDIYVVGEILHDKVYGVLRGLPPDPVVVDAGANIGLFSVWLACRYPGAVSHCFEPEPENYELLRHNLEQFQGFCHPFALGDRAGVANLYISGFAADHSMIPNEAVRRVTTVTCIRLADYLEEHRIERIDLLKLDVEGSELEVLKGLEEKLGIVDRIIGECHEARVNQEALYQFLAHRGHRVVAKRWPPRAADHGVHIFETARSWAPRS